MKNLFKGLSVFALATTIAVFSFSLRADAATTALCRFAYNQSGFITSTKPVFNSICGNVPQNIGSEVNFVRVRQSLNGNDEDTIHNPFYKAIGVSSTCQTGDKFDVWNYIDNDASYQFNPDKGSSLAVAKGTSMSMSYTKEAQNGTFYFNSEIEALNAAAVSDSALLNCGTAKATLSLVPGSVHIYSVPYGNWQNLPDIDASSRFAIGSTSSGLISLGSGQMWGGWTYRIAVVYQVESKRIIVTPVPAKKKVTITTTTNSMGNSQNQHQTTQSTNNTNGQSNNQTTQNTNQTQTQTQTSTNQTQSPSSTTSQTQSSTTSQTNSSTTSQLVNTGPGSIITIFASAMAISSATYLIVLRKRSHKS